jgi:hypothetical protein
VKRKGDDDWVKRCIEFEVDGKRPRGRSKRTCRDVVRDDVKRMHVLPNGVQYRAK